jgi:alpha-glucosidase
VAIFKQDVLMRYLPACVAFFMILAGAALPAQTAQPDPTARQNGSVDGLCNPVADPRAIVTLEHARFTLLTPELIRMEWAADGKFEDHASFVFLNRRLPVPPFGKSISTDGRETLTLRTSALTLVYTALPNGKPLPSGGSGFSKENLEITFNLDGKKVIWHPGDKDSANLQGTTRTLDGAVGGKTGEPLGQGLISRSGWALVDDSTRALFDSADFSFRQGENSPWPWVMERPAGQRQDFYFFAYGHNYRQALGDYVRLAGHIPLPPRFAFGLWWSRFWAYSDQELNELVRGFHENDTPLDVLVIDMDWHTSQSQLEAAHEVDQSGQQLGWSGYTWNHLLFPDPEQLLAQLHASGLKTSLNLHPASGVQPWEDAYPAMAQAMGVDPSTRKYIPFDITDKKFATNYLNLLHHPLEKQGIDFWWLDWQQQAETKLPGVNPTWWLNYVHFTDQQREGKRPLIFHRWGGLGNHRYQIGFSGDAISVWDSLAFQPWFTATAANVAYAYWSHDIGGHLPGSVDPELYTRWVQFGAFSPILRTHTTKNPDSERRPWAYPEPYSSVLRNVIQLRYALQPYIYTEARKTYDSGVAFLRPLYYDWPQEEQAYQSRNEYLFGDLLVAPIIAPADKASGLATESLWLPPGEWLEWPTGKHLHGGATIPRSFSIDQIPVYLRPGAILPMQPPMLYTGEKPVDPLILNIFPLAPGEASSYVLYEDSGNGVEYQKGVFARTPIHATQTADTLRIVVDPVQGNYPGMPASRAYELRLSADWPPEQVFVNGAPLPHARAAAKTGWSFEGNTLTTVIPIDRRSVSAPLTVEVRRAPGLIARRNELDGFAGIMTRLRGVYDAMHQTSPVSDPPDLLVDALQTGDRLSYHPETAPAEIARLHQLLPQVQAEITRIGAAFDGVLEDHLLRYSPERWLPGGMNLPALKQSRTDAMTRALKLSAQISH